jgi:hypothetical protein
MTDLLKEAIADAKAVREVALANAKLALEEAFTPRLQSMLASKLSEEAEDEMSSDEEMHEGEDEDMDDYMEETYDEESMEEGEDEDEFHMTEEDEDEFHMTEEDEDEFSMTEDEGEDFETDEETEEPMDEDLMEIIRQLEEELDSSDIGTGDNKKPSSSASDDHTQTKKEPLIQLVEEEDEDELEEGDVEGDEGDDIDIQEIIRALREEDEEEMHEEDEEEMHEGDEEYHESEEKLEEAYAVIQFLREKINEVNLLNSKLLFSNKLFRSYSLTESQKMTVIENFDRAGSLREVKLVYATLAESLKGRSMKAPKPTKKSSLKEAFNRSASKPQASTRPSKKILTESNEVADRFKKLAGLI